MQSSPAGSVTVTGSGRSRRTVLASLPNALTISRLVVVAGMIAAIAGGASRVCITLALWALFTDVVDGPLARSLGVASTRGARLDSAADCALYLTGPWVALALFPWLQAYERVTVVVIFVAYALPVGYGWLKFRRLTSYHTTAARVAAVSIVVGAAATLATHTAWPLRLAAVVLVVSALEEMAITRVCVEWHAEVRSLLDLPRTPSNTVGVHHVAQEVPMQESRRRLTPFHWSLVVMLGVATAMPGHASAQVSVAGYLGAEFDNQDHWLLFGGEVRLPVVTSPVAPWDAQLRLTYHPYGSGASALQVDANAVMPLLLAHPSRLKPYVGAGAAVVHASGGGESETKVGLNLVTGTTMDLSSTSPVFGILQTQYSIVRKYPNSYTLMVGVGAHLGGSSAGGTQKR